MRLRLGTVVHDLTTRILVMGVLHRAAADPCFDALLHAADRMVGEGADLLDVGSARAGQPIGVEEELELLASAVAAIGARFDIPLSVDTCRARVLADCAKAGAVVAHDASGFADPEYLVTAARCSLAVGATHPLVVPGSDDVVGQVRAFLVERVGRARSAGIPDDRIIVDPGLDLGKSPAQSLTLLRASAALADLGPALLLNASNRRFLGMCLGLDADERRVASHAAHALGIARGCRIVAAHDVRGARRSAGILTALLEARLAIVERGWAPEENDDA